ncbi:MAG: hypothetical protein JNK15_12045 [Planctomycetes bacterium]|nr:hypothetical protein [Planctomycetota bacterium]
MRRTALLATAVFAACSAPPTSDWTAIRRDRLERLHRPQEPAAALRAVIDGAPGRRQDPGHIDQREPQARPFRVPVSAVHATYGFAEVHVDVAGTRLDDRADAHVVSLGYENSSGIGLSGSFTSSDSGLFHGVRINDGVAPADADAALVGGDLFVHSHWHPQLGAVRLPVRLGLAVDQQTLRHERAGVERQWLGASARLVLEPTLRLLGNQERALDAIGRLGGEFGVAWFREDFHGGTDRDTPLRWGGEAGIGLRALFGRWNVDVGYELRHATIGQVDTDLFGRRDHTELQRQQVFVGGGITF